MRVFVEMWCRRQAARALLPLLLTGWLTGESSEALTTFGKSNTQAPNQPAPTPAPGTKCHRQSECAGISGTSCVRTPFEPSTRCLCGDNYAPVNGRCEAQTRTLYHMCSNSDECNDGLVCGTPNITGTTPVHLRVLNQNEKICLCDVETGFREKDYTCNDAAEILKTSIFAILLVVCIRKIIVQ